MRFENNRMDTTYNSSTIKHPFKSSLSLHDIEVAFN